MIFQRLQLVEEFSEIEPHQNAFDAFNAARESGMSAEKIAVAALSKLLGSSPEQDTANTPQLNKSDNGPKAALVLGLGAMDGIERGAITGMVYRVGNLPDGSVGRIEMLDKITAVELPEQFIDQLVEDLDQERVGRRYVRPRRSDDWTFQPEGRHQANAVMVAEADKAVAEKAPVDDTTHEAKVALGAQTADAEHQNKRKGICSLLNWTIHEQHSRPHQALPRSR